MTGPEAAPATGVAKKHGKATSNQVMRLLSAVYCWHRREDPLLPERPTVAVDLHSIRPRDWAMSPEDLRAWLETVQSLSAVKRMWWLTALFTGARKGSIEALR